MITFVSVLCKLLSQSYKNTKPPKTCNCDWLLPCFILSFVSSHCRNVFKIEVLYLLSRRGLFENSRKLQFLVKNMNFYQKDCSRLKCCPSFWEFKTKKKQFRSQARVCLLQNFKKLLLKLFNFQTNDFF